MDFNLDMKTVFISLVFGHIFTVILIRAYRQNYMKDRAVNMFYLSKWVQAIAWFMLIFRNTAPDFFSIAVANSFLFIGAALETASFLVLQKAFSKQIRNLYMGYTTITIIGFVSIYFSGVTETTRIIYASIATSLFILYPAYRMISDRQASSLQHLMGYLYSIVVISLWFRAVFAMYFGAVVGLFTTGMYQTFTFLSLYLIMILGNTGFVLLSKEQADVDLLRIASYDDLTGILNRRTFMIESKNCIYELAKKQQSVSYLLFDIDHYKAINDTYGHHIGDRVLRDMAILVTEQLEEQAIFGRYGGDEFAILLPDTDEQRSSQIAEQLRSTIEHHRFHALPLSYTISVGVVTVSATKETQLSMLYQHSDRALYEAKYAGRNRTARSLVMVQEESG
ncbi:diguanylate cyclase (GGDEF)-like protein [Paenibacillus sp. SORGH_AS306]|uniref:GGDEF domain-containing protein n=1 Tax=unclassified Paenibacillus TaxID=185978 RepID=UPI002784DA59|nr:MULTISPECIES: GGDEF domain-containing protein [unclassified Paenibacillus]MDQ1236315.1 diguanylate cyclase (GGDEF)-like protein [Paenibacillus sp. SORGH_AS_0306]MDR6108669.1 diguanylate cyclase (GGDEF)-like protein [Paenibacillus sp. SORGH_AS_0338]